MAISLRQFNKVYSRHLLEFLKEGIIPSFDDVVLRAGEDLPDLNEPDQPIYKYIPQTSRGVFDIILFNRAMQNILLDLGLLFEEATDIQTVNIQRVLNSELFHSVHSHELKRLSNQLDALLFSIDGADDNFFAAFDNFTDLTKTDTEQSDLGVVDTVENVLLLPIGLTGSLKISLDHLAGLTSPGDLIVSRQDVDNLGNIPGTKLGNVFADRINSWGLIFEADTDGPLDIDFTFRLAREEFLNRLTFTHHGEKSQKLTVRTSVDKVNIKDIPEYSDGIILDDQARVVSVDFNDRLIDYVHLTLSKDQADSFEEAASGVRRYRYMFGLKNISAYVTGRQKTGSYISKPFDFSEDLSAIGRVAISASEFIPDSTRVDWFIAGAVDNELQGEYIAISPQSRNEHLGLPTELLLQDIIENRKNIVTAPGDPILVETFQNLKFYQIDVLPNEPVFGTASLFRGYRSWLRDQSQAVNPVLVRDNFVPFSKSDTQSLYIVREEVLQPTLVTLNNEDAHVVVTSKTALYNPSKGHFLIPEADINPDSDTVPAYAVYRAKLNLADTLIVQENITFENGTASGTTSRTIDLGSKIINYEAPGDIRIEKQPGSGQNLYIDGTDYIVTLDADGFPTGAIVGVHPDFLSATAGTPPGSEWQALKITFNLNPTITRFVQEITGNQVFFDLAAGEFPAGSAIILKYRHVADSILKASVKVKGSFGVGGESMLFLQGQDYILDINNGTIQRVPTGQIDDNQDVYVDFKFNDLRAQLEQFFLWANITDPLGVLVQTERSTGTVFSQENVLTPDTEIGEEFLASIPNVGLINLTLSTEWPTMSGWVQFVVKSTNPSTNEDALINQVIKMKDIDGNFIFKQGGKYFEDITAFRDPLTQVSYPFLRTNVLKNDNSVFAVRQELLSGSIVNQVVVNFLPNTDNRLYSYTASAVATSGLQTVDEEWRIKWVSRESSANAFTQIIVRADLSRDDTGGGNVTPKVNSYFVKVGY
jgi:hypothetical protein